MFERPHPIHRLRSLFSGSILALSDSNVQILIGLTMSVISVATVFYHFVEGWAWIDAAYFSTVTIATVGYGDFTPQTRAGKLFTIGYVLVGIGIFVAACTAFTDRLVRKAHADELARRRAARGGGEDPAPPEQPDQAPSQHPEGKP